ncbi:MAG: patatin-like phospholipase family protein [Candidatus Gracilibacteria bacterium]|nr:patatin-like phospholipase family protein [Candidatus Gracilibacteria bacterium]
MENSDISNNNFSLALGGGGARGLSHIGVIRRLEELGLHPSHIAGTSMGAIIGALYALGRTSHEMEVIIQEIRMTKLIDIDFKKGLLKGKKVTAFLDEIFGGADFSETRIPLQVVATEFDTGKKTVFREGKISDAVRASIGLPGVFTPFEYRGSVFVDGGLVNNLPVELLPEGRVIAVSALRDIQRKIEYTRNLLSFEIPIGLFGNSYSILQKTIDIMLSQNEERSRASRKDICYIHPTYTNLDYYEFHKYEDFIRAGYEASIGIEGYILG